MKVKPTCEDIGFPRLTRESVFSSELTMAIRPSEVATNWVGLAPTDACPLLAPVAASKRPRIPAVLVAHGKVIGRLATVH